MPAIQLYRRAIVRLAVCLLLTMLDALVAPVALYYTFDYWGLFSIVLLLLVPFAWTLGNIWQHTLIDLKLVQEKLAALHLASADQTA
jgi:nucleoside permease NupC